MCTIRRRVMVVGVSRVVVWAEKMLAGVACDF